MACTTTAESVIEASLRRTQDHLDSTLNPYAHISILSVDLGRLFGEYDCVAEQGQSSVSRDGG
jgi:hypothetical protein